MVHPQRPRGGVVAGALRRLTDGQQRSAPSALTDGEAPRPAVLGEP
jgi:hypothetical protein